MPAKTVTLTEAHRAENMRKLAREVEAENDPAILDGALKKIIQHRPEPAKPIVGEK